MYDYGPQFRKKEPTPVQRASQAEKAFAWGIVVGTATFGMMVLAWGVIT